LVALTGGASNPFMLILIAPVTLAAATLPLKPVWALGLLAAAAAGLLAAWSFPLPMAPDLQLDMPQSYRAGAAPATVAGLALTDQPDAASDEVHERLSLRQLVQEVIEPHAGIKGVRVEAIVTGAAGVKTPDIRRLPEILHAFTSFVENAVDFAASEVLVTARF